MRVTVYSFFVFILLFLSSFSYAQTLPIGTPLLEEALRRMQITGGGDSNASFSVRPVYPIDRLDVLNFKDSLSGRRKTFLVPFAKGNGTLKVLPVTLIQQYNRHHPYGWNDGSMIPAKGYQSQLSFGFYSKIGPLSVQVQPEVVLAQNKKFSTFPSYRNDTIWKSYYNVLNRIDDPENYGTGYYLKVFPGQSSVRLNHKKLSLGISTENLWWGPGVRNSLLMSNNAPGFKHITFNTSSPVLSPIGSFEWQIIAGNLQNSNILPSDTAKAFNGQKLYKPKIEDERYLNGMVVTWQPKWTKGLFLGFSRMFYQYKSNVSSSLNGYLPVFGSIFKKNATDEHLFGRDQMLSVFFRLLLPKEKAELYAEYGRNDHSQEMRDLLLEPEHARAYIIGARKIFTTNKRNDFELFMEFTHLQNPETRNVRELEGWYTHYQVRHGYTNLGQVVGAGIGPGGNSQTFGFNWINELKQFGVSFERVVRNNDFYYEAFGPVRNFSSHWVDLSVNLNNSWNYKRFIYKADLSLVKSLNYQWVQYTDVVNLHTRLSASYLF